MKDFFWENIIKNIVILFLLFISYFQIQDFFSNPFLPKAQIGNLLSAVSILAVVACFGNFAFTYEKVRHIKFGDRLLAHLTTGLLMLLIGLSLEMTSVMANLLIPNFSVFNIALILLYLASVLYDFWDLKRTEN